MRKSLTIGSLISILLFSSIFFVSPLITQAATTNMTCTVITSDLWPNSKDSKTQGQVSKLQNFLIAEGYLNATATGNFGPLTESALQAFQKAQKIVSSGNYLSTGYGATGPKTRTAIKNVSCGGAASNSATSGSTAQVSLGCLAGYKFNTLTGQPCSSTAISIAQNSYTPGTSGIYISSTGGNSTTQTQTQTQTQTNPPPPVQTTDHITQYGITWTFDKPYQYGQFANGDYWILGPATIISITPNYANGRNGWNVNPTDIYKNGFDSRNVYFDASTVPPLPYTAQPNSSLIKTTANPNSNGTCSYDQFEACYLNTSSILTVLSMVPPDNGATIFRPGYFGTTKTLYSTNNIQYQLLPSTYITTPSAPSLATIQSEYQQPQLDYYGPFNTNIHPQSALPSYGADIAQKNNEAALRLMLNDPISDKKAALINYIQYGIDLYSMLSNGVRWPPNGGHANGRKLPLTFAATMLNDAAMKNAIKNAPNGTFGEDVGQNGTVYAAQGTATLIFGQTVCPELTYWQKVVLGTSVSGANDCRDPYGYIDGGPQPNTEYQRCCTANPQKGAVLAVVLMPIMADTWNENLINYIDRWMNIGAWTQPDPCAPSDGNWNDYGVTYGPDGHGSCIKDTNPSDGVGRFPSIHGTGAGNTGSGGYGSSFVDEMWNAYRNPPSPPQITISANPATISSGNSSTLNWSTTGALSCTASGGWSGSIATTSGIRSTGNITTTTTYTISCNGYGGSSSQSTTVTVTGAPSTPSTTSGLIGHWTFDAQDISGSTAVDSSSYNNNGTIVGQISSVPGQLGQALSFDGSTNYVTLPPTNFALTSALTLSAWIKPTANTNNSVIVARGRVFGADVQQAAYGLTYANNGYVGFQVSDGTTFKTISSNSPLQLNTWHHIAATFDGTTISLYINGSLVSQATTGYSALNANPAYAKTGIGIGADVNDIGWDVPAFFNGSIDDVRIYNRALSASEVQGLYNGTLSLNTTKNISPVATPSSTNLANVLTSTLNLLPHAVPGTSYYQSIINTLNSILHTLGVK